MSSIEKVLENTKGYLSSKFAGDAHDALLAELEATVHNLIASPQLPVKSTLTALFIRFGLDENVAATLTKSLALAIAKNRTNEFEPGVTPIGELRFPLIEEDAETIVAKIQVDGKDNEISNFPETHLLELLSEAAFTWARFIGSNVAEALAVADPYSVIKTKPHIDLLLAGRKIDPTAIANLFKRLSSEEVLKLNKILSTSITDIKVRNEQRVELLFKEGKASQWLYEKLRGHSFPAKTAKTLVPTLLQKYSIDQLYEASGRQFRQMAVNVITQLPAN